MTELYKYKLCELYEMGSGVSTSKSSAGHGFPFVSFSTIFNNFYLPETLDDLMDTSAKQRKDSSIKEGDVLMTRTSETPNELAFSCTALKDYPEATFSGFAKRLRPKEKDKLCSKYMAFYFRSPYFRKLINSYTTMTLRASFNEHIFSFLDVYLPPVSEQVKIGDLLYAIEEKIRLNNRINDNLQQLLVTIVNQHLSTSKDKKVIPLKKLVKRIISPLNSYAKKIPTIDLSVMPSNSMSLSHLNSSFEFETNLYDMKEGNLLFGSIRPYLNKAGIAPCNGAVAGTIYQYEVLNGKFYNLVLYTLTSKQIFEYATRASHGTKMPVIDSNVLLNYPVEYTDELLNVIESINFKGCIIKNCKEIFELTNLREFLLPLLMNGQATIAD